MGFSNDRANHSLEVAKQMYEKADTFLTNSNKKASALTMNCLFWAKIGLITT